MRKRHSTEPIGTPIIVDRYEIVEMDRRELQGAPYNPRKISESARKKLKTGLAKFGLLNPPVWNKRSGLLVGGHRRLEALDAIHSTDTYRLKVAVTDLSDAEEREANILLNNQEAMGEWDMDGLAALLKTPDLDLTVTGFDHADMFRLFGEDVIHAAPPEAIEQAVQQLRQFRDAYDAKKTAAQEKRNENFYLVVIFRDVAARVAFTTRYGLDDNRYQDGRAIEALIEQTQSGSSGVNQLATSQQG